jgi:hemoglobin
METLYQRLGQERLLALVNHFYDRVFVSEKIGPLFINSDKELVKRKQFLFLSQFLGGPDVYSQEFGHPRMRMRHLPHPIDESAMVEWLRCMKEAIWQLDMDEELKMDLYACFPKVAAHMVNK